MPEQLALPLELSTPGRRPPGGPARFRAGSRVLQVTECFDVYWQFAAERQRIFHRRAAGEPAPWTTDPILTRHKFTSVYRAADRVSQYLIRDVIYAGPQDPDEVVFRVLLFKTFNKIGTWELLTRHLDARPSWAGYSFAACNQILGEAMNRGDRIYSPAYIVPNPPFGEIRKHGNHLRLIEHAMTARLPEAIATAPGLQELYDLLRALPSLGPFLAYQYATDLGYTPITTAQENQFVVAGPRRPRRHLQMLRRHRRPDPGRGNRLDARHLPRASRPAGTAVRGPVGPLAHPDRLAERLLRSIQVHPPVPPPHTRRRRADQDQARVPPDPRGDRLPVPAQVAPPARPDRRGPRSVSGDMNDSDRMARSPRSTPPPFSQTARRHPSPLRIACAHSARLRADTSSAYVISCT
jgi:hypothetical protein